MMVVLMPVLVRMIVVVSMIVFMYVRMNLAMVMNVGDGMCMLVVMVVMFMVMGVVVLPFLLAVDGHRHVSAGDAAGHRRLRRHMDAGETQTVHFLQKGGLLLLAQKLEEGGGEHVSGAPHGAFKVKGFHVTVPPVLPFD